jgi:hypothetical protein
LNQLSATDPVGVEAKPAVHGDKAADSSEISEKMKNNTDGEQSDTNREAPAN